MKPDFNVAFHETKGFEGLYSNNPLDPGGETWMGISRKRNPAWDGWQIIDEIKKNAHPKDWLKAMNSDDELFDLVKSFYKAAYWNPLNLDSMMFQEIANELFDTAVNQGVSSAGKYLQQSLNLLNANQKFYKNIEEDGRVGNGTLAALKAFFSIPGRNEQTNIKVLLKSLNGFQFERYKNICSENESQEGFYYGWVSNRIN